ncbi:MAG: hypothetical protein GY853_10365 [PVC group bacterium]|nr:hypothetical protein [PVC group bacterium]
MTEILYPEYCYVDTAFGGVHFRNNIKKLDEVALPDPPNECYTSMFRFTKEYKEHCDAAGSVKGTSLLPCYCPYLWFDLDDEDIGQAIVSSSFLIIEIQEKLKITPEQLALYFSGCKGFHIGIPSTSLGIEPSVDLPKILKRMALEIAGEIKIDTAIYEKNRLWRLPNSINAKSGLYKIPLDYDELAQLDSKQIKKMAGEKRELQDADLILTTPSQVPSTKLYNKLKDEMVQKNNISPTTKSISTIGVTKNCLEKLLKGVNEGQRNEVGIRLADYLKKQGINQEQAILRLKEWNQHNQPPLLDEEINSIIQSAYTGNYNYGCNDEILKNACEKSCLLHKKDKEPGLVYSSFRELPDGTLMEMAYDSGSNPPVYFISYKSGQIGYVDKYQDNISGNIILPYRPSKIIESQTIHFPSEATDYKSEGNLIEIIDRFIKKYLVISPFFHSISVYYILLSWVYDNFTNLPYLRVRGDYGSGKSRFLMTIGALCYKPIFCMGAATVSPIFRLIDAYKGTVVIDESDFNDSDDSNRIVKILNSGFQKGFPVLLTETASDNKHEPTSYDVFGPKLIASRHEFKDKALESRCLTEIMVNKPIPPDIPINLPLSFWDEAREIRNMLLLWRFQKLGQIEVINDHFQIPVEPRLAQIMIPLLSIIEDQSVQSEFLKFMEDRNKQLIEDRGETLDGKVAETVCRFWADESMTHIRVKNVTNEVNKPIENSKYHTSPKRIGGIMRKVLNLAMIRDGKGFYLERSQPNAKKLANIAKKFGIGLEHPEESAQSSLSATPIEPQQLRA